MTLFLHRHRSAQSISASRSSEVWLPRTDGHMGLANSVALKLVGIDNSSKDSDGGTIMRTVTRDSTSEVQKKILFGRL
ncbi:protein LONG AFTER FAR-RED 3-like [Humulus lupulus]|uniref:protein LONG AFTER FAR-RED 3-like n=1 Tax=Humulus lupulus TaxID=3486 RepID=UPI002B412CE7|nr:protein LONG AFTER FAR-RED 3-like [Humulus lupulus]